MRYEGHVWNDEKKMVSFTVLIIVSFLTSFLLIAFIPTTKKRCVQIEKSDL